MSTYLQPIRQKNIDISPSSTQMTMEIVVDYSWNESNPIMSRTDGVFENSIISNRFSPKPSAQITSIPAQFLDAYQCLTFPDQGPNNSYKGIVSKCGFKQVGPNINLCGDLKWSVQKANYTNGIGYGPIYTPVPGKTWRQCGITRNSLYIIWLTWTPNTCTKTFVPYSCSGYKGFRTSSSYSVFFNVYPNLK